MIQIYEIESPKCIKCNGTDLIMVKVGAIIMCKGCTKSEFGKVHVIKIGTKEHETYKHWLDKWKHA